MQKKQILTQSALFIAFLVAGGLISSVLRFEITYDFLLYHHYNGFAFWHNRLTTDIAAASVATYYNPLLDAALYLLNERCGNDTALYSFCAGLPFGALLFFLFKISLLVFDFKTVKGKICCAAAVIIAATGAATWFQIGTSSHEIFLATFVLAALFLILKYPDKPIVYLPAGFLLGAAAGFKLTAAIYCVSTGLSLILLRTKPKAVGFLMLGGLVGFLTTNGFWMVTLRENFQNPFFPFWNKIFKSPYYIDTDYTDTLHLDGLKWFHFAFLPFFLIAHPNNSNIGVLQELTDFRLAFLFLIGAFYLPFCKKITLSPVMKKLAVWTFVSYVVWLGTAANLRFIVPVETVCAVILVSAFARIKKPASLFKESFYYAVALLMMFILISTTTLSEPWGDRADNNILKEKVALPENTVLEVYHYPLSAVAAEIVKDNPTVKIVSLALPRKEWRDWDVARMGKFDENRKRLLKTAPFHMALYQDAFGIVENEYPHLRGKICQTLKINRFLKTILFSNVKLCLITN